MTQLWDDITKSLGSTANSQTAIIILFLCAMCLAVMWYLRRIRFNRLKKAEEKRDVAEQKAEKTPESLRTRWDAYSAKYEVYIELNIGQNKFIFYSSFLMIVAGIILIIWGIVRDGQSSISLSDKSSLTIIISGAITHLIAGTILVIYKFVFKQTTEHLKTMERFISIGIAMDMLDKLPGQLEEQGLKSITAADLAKLVITHQLGTSSTINSTANTETKI